MAVKRSQDLFSLVSCFTDINHRRQLSASKISAIFRFVSDQSIPCLLPEIVLAIPKRCPEKVYTFRTPPYQEGLRVIIIFFYLSPVKFFGSHQPWQQCSGSVCSPGYCESCCRHIRRLLRRYPVSPEPGFAHFFPSSNGSTFCVSTPPPENTNSPFRKYIFQLLRVQPSAELTAPDFTASINMEESGRCLRRNVSVSSMWYSHGSSHSSSYSKADRIL